MTKRIFALTAACLMLLKVNAQLPDSLRQYVLACVDTMQTHSLYSKRLNWSNIRDTVNIRLLNATNSLDAEATVIWVFRQLEDDHAYYGGIDTSYRVKKPGASGRMSKAILAEYQVPRYVKTQMLDGEIAYFKMPAVLIGSNQEQMKLWANNLTDSICKLEALRPNAYIIDLRMNNGGNIEPMWAALQPLIGKRNRIYTVGPTGKMIKEKKDSAYLAYKAAGRSDNPCKFRKKIPVAVLVGPGTASSGEILSLAFLTRSRTRLFGEPTIGVANVTNGFIIQDKGYLLLTVAYIADRKKHILTSSQIQPHVRISSEGDDFRSPANDPTVQAASQWLRARR